ncbi:class E sortase [Micropruina sp.]|uniref:class E sortase n=1 Tax=Micropruina sp. TaxID=2737536 RepID=UPI0039E4CD87
MGETSTVTPRAIRPDSPAPKGRRRLLTVLGVLLMATGLSFLGLYVWDAYFNPVMDVKAAQQQVDEVKKEWAQGRSPSSTIPGNAVALMRIPEFGADYEVAVVTGTTPYSLNVGVGWFDHTAAPGKVGNFAVAGHRGASGPFVPLLDLKPGSKVIVETRTAVYTYALTNYPKDLTVDKYETWVIDPVPGHPDQKPTEALITLITCRNFFHSAERSVAFGELVETVEK